MNLQSNRLRIMICGMVVALGFVIFSATQSAMARDRVTPFWEDLIQQMMPTPISIEGKPPTDDTPPPITPRPTQQRQGQDDEDP